jgi:hypothetical protein
MRRKLIEGYYKAWRLRRKQEEIYYNYNRRESVIGEMPYLQRPQALELELLGL